MKVRTEDIIVIVMYLAVVSFIGLCMRKQAGRSGSDYMLAGKKMPYWMLGVSNASGMFDISGTAWMVAVMFVYGVKSIWLPWLWPVFNQVFMMIYLSVWLKRSNVSTGAEWILSRFGTGRDALLSHRIVIGFALLTSISFMTYGFVGLGKFIAIFIPWDVVQEFVPMETDPAFAPHIYGVVFTLITVFYALLGGMKSIVWNDLIHYVIMVVVSVSVAILAMKALWGKELPVPDDWASLFSGTKPGPDWTGLINGANEKIKSDGFSPFWYFFGLMTAKGVLTSMAGPSPNYDMQKILSARSPREAAMMSMIVNVVLLPVRYLLIMGVTVLGLMFYRELDIAGGMSGPDFERLLPAVLNAYLPPGLLGLALVALLGAFMGTFAGTFNASQAYLVHDIYLRSVNPAASGRSIVRVNYLSGLILVAVSLSAGFLVKDINSILQWIVGALYGGYIAANILKWHWWRFNGLGFFWGMLAGILSALILPRFFPGVLPLSLAGAVAGTLAGKPADMEVLKKFYITAKPWGFWKEVQHEVQKEYPDFKPDERLRSDIFNVLIGIATQTALTAFPVFLVLMMPQPLFITATILVIGVLILRKTWYDRLPPL